jgi:hypothetical protein
MSMKVNLQFCCKIDRSDQTKQMIYAGQLYTKYREKQENHFYLNNGKHTFKDISSIPLVVNTTLAPALRIFSIRSFVMSDSLSKSRL